MQTGSGLALALAGGESADYRTRVMLGPQIAGVIFGVSVCMAASLAHGQPKDSDTASPAAATAGASSESGSGSAADAAARERAKQLYEQGQLAYRQGRYSEAIDKLLEADRAMPNAAFSYNIALVYEKMGDQRSALRWLRSYLRQSGKGVNDEATQAKVRKFEGELQARGLQQVSILSNPAGATLQVDGHALGLTPFTTELTPGMHRLALSLPGYALVQKDFELRSDRSLDVEVTLEEQPAEEAPTPDSPHPALGNQRLPGERVEDANQPAPAVSPLKPEPLRPMSSPTPQPPTPRVTASTWIGL
ncbi:MAG: PEGA domain-containing protein, partial [Myxococcales bacterium]